MGVAFQIDVATKGFRRPYELYIIIRARKENSGI